MPEAAKTILNVLLILAAPVGKMPRIGKKNLVDLFWNQIYFEDCLSLKTVVYRIKL